MNQTQEFLDREGDAWFQRNRARIGLRDPDPVDETMRALKLTPVNALEIGCANGWRLKRMRDQYNCWVSGIDASEAAAREAWKDGLDVRIGRADDLPFVRPQFDVVIFAFCLYVCDPGDLLRIAAEADRVLLPRGHIVIHDFALGTLPFAREYEHREGLFAYHMDFAQLWMAHPWYTRIGNVRFGDQIVAVLRKDANSLPVLP